MENGDSVQRRQAVYGCFVLLSGFFSFVSIVSFSLIFFCLFALIIDNGALNDGNDDMG